MGLFSPIFSHVISFYTVALFDTKPTLLVLEYKSEF